MEAPSRFVQTNPNRSIIGPAWLIAGASALALVVVWALQYAGYAPCELCFRERLPFYWGVPLACLVAWIARSGRRSLLPAGYAALGIMFLAGASLGIYHTGVEWHLWPGPSSCTGGYVPPTAVNDFLNQLQTTQVVQCDAPALHVLGLSLAAWNVVLCLALVVIAALGFVRSDAARN